MINSKKTGSPRLIWNLKILNKIKYIEIKDILKKYKLEVESNFSDEEEFLNLKTIANSLDNDLSFFSNIRYLNDLKKNKSQGLLD